MPIQSVKNALFYIALTLLIFAISCINQKQITYFQPKEGAIDTLKTIINPKFTLLLKPGNIISVGVSSISPEANAMFNPYTIMQPLMYNNTQTNNILPAVGFTIDDDGAITLPMAGKVIVAGLNIKQASELIVQKLENFLVNPTVNVRMLNYSVSVLGEVVKPSVYIIPNERITLPEVLSLAGDLTIFARRDNVMIIRESEGKREFARVDITKRDLFNSPYYYLQPNDVVYVEPGKGKKTTTDRAIQIAPTVISGLSLFAVLISIIFKK